MPKLKEFLNNEYPSREGEPIQNTEIITATLLKNRLEVKIMLGRNQIKSIKMKPTAHFQSII